MNELQNTGYPSEPEKTDRRLKFALLAAPIAWFLHEVIGVSIVGRTCQVGGGLFAPWQWAVLIVVPLAAAAVAVAAAVTALGTFRGSSRTRITAAEGWSRVEFMSQFAFFLNLLLLLNIVYFGLVPLLVEPCRTVSG